MTLSLLIAIAIALQIGVTYFIFWLVSKLFKIRIANRQLLIVVAALTLFQLALLAIGSRLDSAAILALVPFVFFIGELFIWHILLNRYTQVSFGRSLVSYITGSVVASILLAITAIIALSFVQVFQVQGSSMEPSLPDKARVLAYKKNLKPEEDSIVIYRTSDNKTPIGRIKGLPGETVSVPSGRILINNQFNSVKQYKLQSDEYFVVPDNSQFVPSVIKRSQINALVGHILSK